MATLFPVAGSKIYIGSAAMATTDTDWVASDFTGISWLEIDAWTQMGAFGDAAEAIRTNLINRGRTVKQKGTRDAGSMENVFALSLSDPGQQQVIAADKTNLEWPVRIDFDDAPDAVSPAVGYPTQVFFTALVNGARFGGGEANTVHTLNSTFEINSNIVTVESYVA